MALWFILSSPPAQLTCGGLCQAPVSALVYSDRARKGDFQEKLNVCVAYSLMSFRTDAARFLNVLGSPWSRCSAHSRCAFLVIGSARFFGYLRVFPSLQRQAG